MPQNVEADEQMPNMMKQIVKLGLKLLIFVTEAAKE